MGEPRGRLAAMKSKVACVPFTTYQKSIQAALEAINAATIFAQEKRIVIKPNLVDDIAPPFTTPVECVEAIIQYVRSCSQAEIMIGEGAGGMDVETSMLYEKYGYNDIAEKFHVRLIDFNTEEVVCVKNRNALVLKEFHYPKILQDAFLVTVPTLKAHSMAKVTLGLKSMIGVAPPNLYQKSPRNFKKSVLHGKNNAELHKIIFDVNTYLKPDCTIIDASVGCPEAHLWGRLSSPPRKKIIASLDVVAADRVGTEELGHTWKEIAHIVLSHGTLGNAEDVELIKGPS